MIKKIISSILRSQGYTLSLISNRSPQIGAPASGHYLSLEKVSLSPVQLSAVTEFRTDRYFWINEYRWRLLLQTGISLKEKVIFEPGAGIGDQTSWLLQQGVKHVIVSEGREDNFEVIQERFRGDSRVTPILGNLEDCLDSEEFSLQADLIYLWGVYYHILDPLPTFPILHQLSNIAPIIVMDFQQSLTGDDYVCDYPYDNPSASISHSSWRLTPSSMVTGLASAFGNVYFPREQMNWNDPSCLLDPRRIIIGSKSVLDLPGLQKA